MAAILHMGNVEFTDDGESASVLNKDATLKISKLLEVDGNMVQEVLTTRTVSAGGDIISAQHTVEVADYGRVSK